MIFSIVFIFFFVICSASAVDLNNVSDNLSDNIVSSQNLEFYNPDSTSGIDYDGRNNHSSNELLESGSENIKPTVLSGNNTELYFNSNTTFKVVLSDDSGSLLANQSIIFTINNINYTKITNDAGVASIAINLNSGNYNITSFYAGSSKYGSSSVTNSVKVLSTIFGKDIVKYYRNDTQYYATFVDSQGNLLKNSLVTYNITGVFYQRKTNEKGVARLNINLDPGNYVLTAFNPVNGESYSNNISVLTTVLCNDIVKYYKNATQFYVTLVDGEGNPLVNNVASFNINGVYYSRSTNENGVARLNINLDPGNYTITTINPINGNVNSNNVEVLPTIFTDDLNMIYKDGSRFSAHVIDGRGNALANSIVTFNVNGVFYTRISDDNGNAYLNINLNIGRYIITSTNENGLSVSNTIIINKCNSIIEGNDAHIITGTDRDYTVKLTGLNNKSIDSAIVHFNYDGNSINAITNELGEATITLHDLSEGKHIINFSFDGNMNYYSSKSYNSLIVAKPTVLLTANNLNMIYNDGSKFNVTLTDLNYNPLVNQTITFTLNGVNYNRITNDKGIASLNINLIPGTYSISYSHGEVDDLDYNIGSKTITISKISTTLTANDLYMNNGDTGAFYVTLTNNGNPIENIIVTFNINGVSYNRITNSSGVAKLNINLNVGYYTITTSLDNTFYSANTISNHILVNGTILNGNDLKLIAGLSRDYTVLLLDAYKNPISNAGIEFTYNNVVKYANTNAQGLATITVDNLPKGVFPIVYKYIADDNVGQSNIYVSQSVLNSKNTISNLDPYLSNSNNCQVSNAEIITLAKQLTEGLTKPLDKAIAIYDYVNEAISYSYYYNTYYGALGTLHNKIGNCVDQAHLSIALYRAAGLPARYVNGICVFSDGDVIGHVWAQVLVEDTWVVSDSINSRNSLGEVVNWNNYNYQLKGYYSSIYF